MIKKNFTNPFAILVVMLTCTTLLILPFINKKSMKKEIITTSYAPAPIGSYSQAVKTGGMLFTSGQIAIDPATNTYTPSTIEDETLLVMTNLKAVLESAKMDFGHVVKTSIFLSDMNDFSKVNAVYSSYFKDNFPARETVQVSVLPKNAKVEISMIAAE